jgi:CRISPR system Cascade subunit CasC
MKSVELHVIQNFGPSCLNRDESGAPKDCEFGGHRRARLSSQAQKRSSRLYAEQNGLLDPEMLAVRTRRLADECAKELATRGREEDKAYQVVASALNSIKKKDKKSFVTDKGVTQYLLFIGKNKIKELADFCEEHWTELDAGDSENVKKGMEKLIKEDKAVDLALFGRMLADLPQHNVDAACQVAHAISTNRIQMEFDYYTAVDDLNPEDDEGAGMIGTTGFDSPCYYRYAHLDLGQLLKNLGGDAGLARTAAEAFIKSFVFSIPSGRQNVFAAHNPPSMVLAVVKDGMPANLGNAFAKPVSPGKGVGLIEGSIQALCSYWDELESAFGSALGVEAAPLLLVGVDLDGDLSLKGNMVSSYDELAAAVLERI